MKTALQSKTFNYYEMMNSKSENKTLESTVITDGTDSVETTAEPTQKQKSRVALDLKIAKLPKDDEGRPIVKSVTVGSTTVHITTVINHNYWAFQVPYYPNGARERRLKTFADPDEARMFAFTVANGKAEHLGILKGLGPEQIGAIAKVAELLLRFCELMKITLEAALEEYIGAKTVAGERSLVTCIKDYLAQPWVTKCQMLLPEVIKDFLRAKQLRNCKRSTLLKMYYVLNAFSRRINGRPLAQVSKEQIEAEIFSDKRQDRSNYTYYCELHGFYAWARRNGYLRPDQMTAMDAVEPPLYDKKCPEVIQPEEAIRIIKMLKDPECILYVVLCLFSGGRCEELNTVGRELIAPSEFFTINAEDAKKRKEKTIKIGALLDQWLRPWYGRKGYLMKVATIQMKIARLIKQYNQMLKATGSAEPPIVWKRNWLRHSFSTYQLHFTMDLIDTAEECDHEPATMAQYYLIRVSKGATQAYFSLTPEACGLANWAQIVAAHLAETPELYARIPRKRKQKPGLNEGEEQSAVMEK
jgi:site-specific recombinase XerD